VSVSSGISREIAQSSNNKVVVVPFVVTVGGGEQAVEYQAGAAGANDWLGPVEGVVSEKLARRSSWLRRRPDPTDR
jgi:hypothetical protein